MLKIEQQHLNRILTLVAISRYEVCGILSAWPDGEPADIYECVNIHQKPQHYYAISSDQQFKAFNHMESKGTVLAAIYHSHPDSHPIPSAEDIRTAFYPDVHYIIAGLTATARNGGKRYEAVAYIIRDGAYEKVSMNIKTGVTNA